MLAGNGHDVGLWARKPEVAAAINADHRNPRYLSDVVLSERIAASSSHEEVLEGACAAVIVTPSSIMRDVADRLAGLVALHHVLDDRVELALLRRIDEVGLILADHRLVRGDRDDVDLVG